jgi:predicted N-formylglutamate amidohydrolase
MSARYRLLEPDEPGPVLEVRRGGASPFVIAVDHASRRIPRRLGNLGLPSHELERHIAWDIGALAVARKVASALDAPLVAQNYSRLVIDCNRRPGAATSIPLVSESTRIPGNAGLSEAEVDARRDEVFQPYHDHLRALLDERERKGQHTIFLAQHSMTDVFNGVRREMHGAILYNRDRRFAALMLERLRREDALIVEENLPYSGSEATDYTIPFHIEPRGLPYVEIEIRQDLIRNDAGQTEWAARIARTLGEAASAFVGPE